LEAYHALVKMVYHDGPVENGAACLGFPMCDGLCFDPPFVQMTIFELRNVERDRDV
jgi:hypothetical protein